MSTDLAPAIATVCGAVFAGAAAYVSFVEHPARIACGPAVALRQFAPSYHRGTIMQASLAVLGALAGVLAWWMGGSVVWAFGAAFLGFAVPFTLIAIFPTNHKLLDPALEPTSPEAARLLARWGDLHAVRTVVGFLAFGFFLLALFWR